MLGTRVGGKTSENTRRSHVAGRGPRVIPEAERNLLTHTGRQSQVCFSTKRTDPSSFISCPPAPVSLCPHRRLSLRHTPLSCQNTASFSTTKTNRPLEGTDNAPVRTSSSRLCKSKSIFIRCCITVSWACWSIFRISTWEFLKTSMNFHTSRGSRHREPNQTSEKVILCFML